MRTLLRIGGIAGMLAGALSLALAPRIGALALACVVASGLAAGLAAAKWLPRAWYGRQFGAGLRAGLVSCVIAAPATVIALLDGAPRDAATLAARTRIMASPLGTAVGTGWVATDVLAVIAAALASLALAAISARIFAASKSARFVTAVARARDASQPLREESFLAPALARRIGMPLHALSGASAGPQLLDRSTSVQPAAAHSAPPRRTLAPVTPPEGIAGSATGGGGQRTDQPLPPRRTVAPAGRALPSDSMAVPLPASPPAPPPSPAAAPGAGAPALKRRGAGRPAPARLTPEMIEALAAWARDTEERDDDGEDGSEAVASGRTGADKSASASASRQPVESTYLNEPAPAPKRKRKKNATRDWIC